MHPHAHARARSVQYRMCAHMLVRARMQDATVATRAHVGVAGGRLAGRGTGMCANEISCDGTVTAPGEGHFRRTADLND